MTQPRYALYLAPPPDTPLWRFGSAVLGHDAASGEDMHGFATAGLSPEQWRSLTQRPRLYGFHCTLKAPIRLHPDTDEPAFLDAIKSFAASRQAFDAGPLAATSVALDGSASSFVALTLQRHSAELAALETATVTELDRFRAPATPEETAKRAPERLTPRQRESLARFGYPYTGADYTPHMTLTGATEAAPLIADALGDMLANEIGTAHLMVDALVLFIQPAPGAPFRIARRFALQPTG